MSLQSTFSYPLPLLFLRTILTLHPSSLFSLLLTDLPSLWPPPPPPSTNKHLLDRWCLNYLPISAAHPAPLYSLLSLLLTCLPYYRYGLPKSHFPRATIPPSAYNISYLIITYQPQNNLDLFRLGSDVFRRCASNRVMTQRNDDRRLLCGGTWVHIYEYR